MASLESIVFRAGSDGEEQQTKLEALIRRSVSTTMYADENSLHTLRISNSVNWMSDRASLTHFCACRDNTYLYLTLEFLSSLIYTTRPDSASTISTVRFRMFNREYRFDTNNLTALLIFPSIEGALCDAPLDTN